MSLKNIPKSAKISLTARILVIVLAFAAFIVYLNIGSAGTDREMGGQNPNSYPASYLSSYPISFPEVSEPPSYVASSSSTASTASTSELKTYTNSRYPGFSFKYNPDIWGVGSHQVFYPERNQKLKGNIQYDVITLSSKQGKLIYSLSSMYESFGLEGHHCWLAKDLKIFKSTKTENNVNSKNYSFNGYSARNRIDSEQNIDLLVTAGVFKNKPQNYHNYMTRAYPFVEGLNDKAKWIAAHYDPGTDFNVCKFDSLGTYLTQNNYSYKFLPADSEYKQKKHYFTGVDLMYTGDKSLLPEADKVFLSTKTSLDKVR